MPKEIITDPVTVELLDQMMDEDELELRSDKKENSFDVSSREVEDLINHIFASIAPDWLSIDCNRKQILITDRKRGIEYVYSKWAVTPIVAPDSLTRGRDEFEVQKIIAQKRKELGKKIFVRRGKWTFEPELEYNRLNLTFEEGGSVPCGLPSGEDCVPARFNGDVEFNDTFALIGLGEFVWSRPAVAALDPDNDLEKGSEILSIIHDHYRMKARGRHVG
jgi:hypothetical protein